MNSPTYGGVMEIGRYIDFHLTDSTADYDGRLYIDSDGKFVANGKYLALKDDIPNVPSLKSTSYTGTTSSSAVLTIPLASIGASDSSKVVNVIQTASNDYGIIRLWYDSANLYAFIRKISDGSIAASVSVTVRAYYIE